jgi:hypothetical protein
MHRTLCVPDTSATVASYIPITISRSTIYAPSSRRYQHSTATSQLARLSICERRNRSSHAVVRYDTDYTVSRQAGTVSAQPSTLIPSHSSVYHEKSVTKYMRTSISNTGLLRMPHFEFLTQESKPVAARASWPGTRLAIAMHRSCIRA